MKIKNEIFYLKNFKVSVKIFLPEKIIKRNLILLTAIGVEADKYYKLINELVDLGYQVITANYPAYDKQEFNVSKKNYYGYQDLSFDFISNLVKFISKENNKPPVIIGHSLGAQLATFYSLHANNKADIIGIATGFPSYKDFTDIKWKFKLILSAILFPLITLFKGYFPGKKIGFGGEKEPSQLMYQWSKLVLTENIKPIVGNNYKISKNNNCFINIDKDEWAPIKCTKHLANFFEKPIIKKIQLPTEIIIGNPHSIWIKNPTYITKIIDDIINKW